MDLYILQQCAQTLLQKYKQQIVEYKEYYEDRLRILDSLSAHTRDKELLIREYAFAIHIQSKLNYYIQEYHTLRNTIHRRDTFHN
jgi:hypothetical protein